MEHVDVVIVGAGPVRDRRRAPPPGPPAAQDLRDPRGARRDRRHVGPVPLPGRALGQRHVHARLPLPAVGGVGRARRRPVDPRPTCARPRARRGSTATCASATASRARRGRTGAGRSASQEREPLTCSFLYVCGGYYRYDAGYLPEFAGRSSASRAGSCTHSSGPRTSTTPASASWSSAAGRPRSRSSPRWPRRAAHVTMLQRSPTYILSIPSEDPIANRLRRLLGDRRAYRDHALEERRDRDARSTSSASASRSSCAR